jgi:ketosteroid isomerase-like protein
MDRAQLADWVERYERAWRAPGTDALAELFTEDAIYSTTPYAEPHRGLEAIRVMWDAERTPEQEFTMAAEIVAADGELGVVRLRVDYRVPRFQQYRDLWVIRLEADGRCSSFEEWPYWQSDSGGAAAAGA